LFRNPHNNTETRRLTAAVTLRQWHSCHRTPTCPALDPGAVCWLWTCAPLRV